MKTKLSILLFFAFLFCSSQEIADKEKFKKCRKEFSKKICLSDEDKDSVLFYLDECPKIFGVPENNGCAWADTDNDGIFDKDDACPDVSGPEENHGCPWPDTDGDGILDKDDKCPTVVGIPEKNGCPGKDCKKLYEAEKIDYEEGLQRINEIDFDKLYDIILNDEEFKNYFSINKKIVFLNFPSSYGGAECGNDPYYDCPHFEKHLYDEITKKIWNKTNFEKLRKKIKNSFIIPTVTDGRNFEFGEQDEKANFFSLNEISSFLRR